MKKILSIFLVIAMLVTTCAVSAATYTDIDGHWAKNEIEAWSNHGVISGYDGQFSPNRFITRGEFAVVLSRLMGYQKESENVFKDLPAKFYTSYVLKLYKAGVMQGYDGYISPEASLTREEASVMICRALGINTAETMNKSFSDVADVSSWSKGYINAMVNAGLLNGADGKLNPKNPISRAEVVKILDNAVYPILKAGTVENVNTGKILLVSIGNVTVKNAELGGKVIISQGVSAEKVTFANSKIKADIVIDNDRSAFIKLENTTVANASILNHKAFITDSTGGSESTGGEGGSTGGGGVGGDGGGESSTTTTYTVTFNVNGQNHRTIHITSGSTIGIQMPADPSVAGHIFLGWKDFATGNPVTAGTVVTGAMTVIAEFKAESGNDGTGDETTGDNEVEGDTGTGGEEEDSEMVKKLKAVSEEIALYTDRSKPTFYSVFNNTERYMLTTIKTCIDDAVANHKNEIDADFIKVTYETEISNVHAEYKKMSETGADDAFIGKLGANFATYNLIWLADTLGIDLSKYGIDVSEFI